MGFFFLLVGLPPSSPLFPYTTLFRSVGCCVRRLGRRVRLLPVVHPTLPDRARDRRRLRDLPGPRSRQSRRLEVVMQPFVLAWLLAQIEPTQPNPTPTTPADAELERQLEEALAADKAAAQTTSSTTSTSGARPSSSTGLLNPDISVIGTFSAAARADSDVPPSFAAGDDPAPTGLTAQEIEITFTADVDPYFKMRLFLAIPQLDGVEVEEGYLLTTSLPRGLQAKAGVFRSAFGRNNEQHLHMQDFARRPYLTYLLGDDGLKPPGVQGSILLPLPWFTTVYAEVLTLAPGGEAADQVSFTGILEQFFELSDAWSLLVGLSFASLDRGPDEEADPPTGDPPREYLGGGDVYLKWKPASGPGWPWIAFTAEYIQRRSTVGSDADGAG